MRDRFGNVINVGWTFSEEEWLTAALAAGREQDLIDFCDYSGRTMEQTKRHLYVRRLREARAKLAAEKAAALKKLALPIMAVSKTPSALRQLSARELMAGRAPRASRHP